MKTLSYSNVKYTHRLSSILLTVKKIERENFDFVLLSFPSRIPHKLDSIYERSACQTTPLLSEIFLFLVRAACKLRLASNGPKHTCGLFPAHYFMRNYMYNSKTKGCIRTFYQSNDYSTIGHI